MTKTEILLALNSGCTVRHQYFDTNEWVRKNDDKTYILEDGVICLISEFWKYRYSDGFNDGWEILPICPCCKGTGKQTLKVSTFGSNKSAEHIEINCIDCNGKQLSANEVVQIFKQKEYEKNLWCSCQNIEPNDVKYIEDGKSNICKKHHWIHTKCGKITQIG